MPKRGYTNLVSDLLDHKNINVHLNTSFKKSLAHDYQQIFYSGPIDAWFEYSEGQLGYRTLDFGIERYDGDYQGNTVINYCDLDVPWTRISEHKYFSPWESHSKTVIYREFSRQCEFE